MIDKCISCTQVACIIKHLMRSSSRICDTSWKYIKLSLVNRKVGMRIMLVMPMIGLNTISPYVKPMNRILKLSFLVLDLGMNKRMRSATWQLPMFFPGRKLAQAVVKDSNIFQ